MKYTLHYTGEFKQSLKCCLKRGYDEQLLTDVLDILAAEGRLPENYHPARSRDSLICSLRMNQRVP